MLLVIEVEEYFSELFSDPGSVSYDGMLENPPWISIEESL